MTVTALTISEQQALRRIGPEGCDVYDPEWAQKLLQLAKQVPEYLVTSERDHEDAFFHVELTAEGAEVVGGLDRQDFFDRSLLGKAGDRIAMYIREYGG